MYKATAADARIDDARRVDIELPQPLSRPRDFILASERHCHTTARWSSQILNLIYLPANLPTSRISTTTHPVSPTAPTVPTAPHETAQRTETVQGYTVIAYTQYSSYDEAAKE